MIRSTVGKHLLIVQLKLYETKQQYQPVRSPSRYSTQPREPLTTEHRFPSEVNPCGPTQTDVWSDVRQDLVIVLPLVWKLWLLWDARNLTSPTCWNDPKTINTSTTTCQNIVCDFLGVADHSPGVSWFRERTTGFLFPRNIRKSHCN